MEQRNIIKWSEHSEYTELTIPNGEIWMSESEMVELFGVFILKLRNAIKSLQRGVGKTIRVRADNQEERQFVCHHI